MISKLPRWVWVGGAVLSFIAGMINAVGFLSFQGVTHLTGTTTALSIALSSGSFSGAGELAAVLASFVLGAMLCGLIIQSDALQLGQGYGIALIIESFLLLGAIPLLAVQSIAGNCLASCACGLQNAMATTYSGAAIRTTHVSGLFTDLGMLFGHRLRGMAVSLPRMKLLLYLVTGFFIGGIAGTALFNLFGVKTLLFPAALTGLAGVLYIMYGRFNEGK